MRTPFLAIALVLSIACAPRPGDSRAPSGAAATRGDADGGIAAAPGVPDAGPRPLPVLAAEAFLPDGRTIALSPEAPALVDPAARFRIAVGAELTDARLAVLDAADAAVPSTGAVEIGAASRFTLEPSEPLRPGSSYLVRLDGAASSEIHGARGETFAPLVLQVRTAGDPPAPVRHGRARRLRNRR